jgi:hypothetical protein
VWAETGLIVGDDNLPRRGHCIVPLSVLCREPDVHCPQTVIELRQRARSDDRAGDPWLLRHPGERHLAGRCSVLVRQGLDHIEHPEGGVGEVRVPPCRLLSQAAPRRRPLTTAVFTAQKAAGQGDQGIKAKP